MPSRSSDPPRRYSQRALPAYRHLPGQTPHPERDPEGHSFGRPEPKVSGWRPETWRENETYLYGVDLFNLGYWWEAHAELEALWKAGPNEISRTFLRGLIQAAAALLQFEAGRRDGGRKLIRECVSKLREVAAKVETDRYMGVDVTALADTLEALVAKEMLTAAPPELDLA